MADIFLSYAREDREFAGQLAVALQRCGWTVWWDRTIPAGVNFRGQVAQQLKIARCVVVLWSRRSITSDWVTDEAEDGKQRGVLVQALMEHVVRRTDSGRTNTPI